MSATANADAEGVVSKVQVKKEIKTIVENLETILGDLKDVAKELKEVKGSGSSASCRVASHCRVCYCPCNACSEDLSEDTQRCPNHTHFPPCILQCDNHLQRE